MTAGRERLREALERLSEVYRNGDDAIGGSLQDAIETVLALGLAPALAHGDERPADCQHSPTSDVHRAEFVAHRRSDGTIVPHLTKEGTADWCGESCACYEQGFDRAREVYDWE